MSLKFVILCFPVSFFFLIYYIPVAATVEILTSHGGINVIDAKLKGQMDLQVEWEEEWIVGACEVE